MTSVDNGYVRASRTDRVLILAVVLVALTGLFDAWVIEEPETALLFGTALALALVLLARTLSKRRPLRVRADLAVWMQQRSDLTGEPVEQIADRALATYRLQLGEEADEPEPPPTR